MLHHGPEIIDFFQKKFECGIGYFTEESSEALNHLLKEARLKSRRSSRIDMNSDTFRNLLNRTCSLDSVKSCESFDIDIEEFY